MMAWGGVGNISRKKAPDLFCRSYVTASVLKDVRVLLSKNLNAKNAWGKKMGKITENQIEDKKIFIFLKSGWVIIEFNS